MKNNSGEKVSTGKLIEAFRDCFDTPPHFVIRASGRVNLIGEHTDYNDGFVLPMALDRAVWLLVRPREDGEVRLHSLDFGETAVFHLNHLYKEEGHWSECAKGVAWLLQKAGYTLRMTGAGFGGCVVALVKEDTAVTFAQTTARQYQQKTGLKPRIYVCQAAAGVEAIANL